MHELKHVGPLGVAGIRRGGGGHYITVIFQNRLFSPIVSFSFCFCHFLKELIQNVSGLSPSPILSPIALSSHCFCGPDSRREWVDTLHTDTHNSHTPSSTLIKTMEGRREIGGSRMGKREGGERQNVLRQREIGRTD